MFWSIVAICLAVELLKLAELFFKGHSREESIDLFFYFGLGGRSEGGKKHKCTKAQSRKTLLVCAFALSRRMSLRTRVCNGAKKNTSRRCAFVFDFRHRARS